MSRSLETRFREILASERGSDHSGILVFLFLVGGFTVAAPVAFFLLYRVVKKGRLSAEEEAARPWWPREYLAVGAVLFAWLCGSAVLEIFSLKSKVPSTAGMVAKLLFIYVMAAVPAALFHWRLRMKEPTPLAGGAMTFAAVLSAVFSAFFAYMLFFN